MAIIMGSPYTPNYASFSAPAAAPASTGMSASTFGGWAQMFGVLASAWGAKISAKNNARNMQFQGDMSMLNARSSAQMGSINANYTSKATLLGASYAEAMARIQGDVVRQTAKVNAQIADMGAESVLHQGDQQVASLTLKAGQMKGAQRAAMAANGIDLGEGNAVDVLASTEIMKEIDKNQITSNAIRSAWGYRTQGVAAQIEGNTQAVNIEIRGRNEAAGIRTQGAQDLFQIQTRAASDEFAFRSTGNASYAASNAISPDRAFAGSLVSGAMGVADTWYKRSKVS